MSEASAPATEIHHSHGDVSGGWLRAAVFGAMDGLVTNTALVAGVGGGRVSAQTIVLSGVASLVAGAMLGTSTRLAPAGGIMLMLGWVLWAVDAIRR